MKKMMVFCAIYFLLFNQFSLIYGQSLKTPPSFTSAAKPLAHNRYQVIPLSDNYAIWLDSDTGNTLINGFCEKVEVQPLHPAMSIEESLKLMQNQTASRAASPKPCWYPMNVNTMNK